MGAFGERLKSEREKRKITLEEIALATKIGTRMLRALEEEKFDLLPGGIFTRGFVRAYARHIGISEDQAVADYTEAFRASHPEPPPLDPEAEGRQILEQRALRVQQDRRPAMERIPWGKAAVALMLLAFAFALWGSYSRHAGPKPVAAAAPKKRVTKPAPQASEGSVAKNLARSQAPAGLASESQPAPPELVSASAENVAVSTPGTFRVMIRAREDSWLQITADGKDVLQDTLLAESQKSVKAHSEVVVRAGNIGALEFWFNGQKLPAQGNLDQVKTVTFDSAGLVSPAARIEPVAAATER